MLSFKELTAHLCTNRCLSALYRIVNAFFTIISVFKIDSKYTYYIQNSFPQIVLENWCIKQQAKGNAPACFAGQEKKTPQNNDNRIDVASVTGG